MAAIRSHEIRALDKETYTTDTANEHGRILASIEPATAEEIGSVMIAAEDDNGRSNWVWIRLPNGDLFLGVAPQGDTYELVTQNMIKGRV